MAESQFEELSKKIVTELAVTKRMAKKAVKQAGGEYEKALILAKELAKNEQFALDLLGKAALPRNKMNLARSISKEANYDLNKALWLLRRAKIGERWNTDPHPPPFDKEPVNREIETILDLVRPCYQCGTCSGGCPVFNIDAYLNPRFVVERLILETEGLFKTTDEFWQCTTCHNCSQVCPQGVDLSHALMLIKNFAIKMGSIPQHLLDEANTLWKQGIIGDPKNPAILRKREKFNLPNPVQGNHQEVQKLLLITGLKKILDIAAEKEEE